MVEPLSALHGGPGRANVYLPGENHAELHTSVNMPVDSTHARDIPGEQVGEERRAIVPTPDRVERRQRLFYAALHTDGDFALCPHNTIVPNDRTSVQ